jgi:hypothetical protein
MQLNFTVLITGKHRCILTILSMSELDLESTNGAEEASGANAQAPTTDSLSVLDSK